MKDLRKLEDSVIYALRELYHKYGYSQFKMSKFEPYDLYMLNKEFLVSDGIITFTDTDGTLMALKPDVTLSIVKNYKKERSAVQKVCYSENVYRTAGAGHSYREIMQTGLECLGDVGLYEISEVICLAARSLRTISPNFVLDLSHMGIISHVLAPLQLSDDELADILRFLGEKNKDALKHTLGEARSKAIVSLMEISGPILESLPRLTEIFGADKTAQLTALAAVLDRAGLADHVHLDFSIISDRNYYNDFVFRGYVEGIPSTVLAGGQYDRLMDKMKKQAKGIGFAVYLDQLQLLDTNCPRYDIDTIILYSETDSITLLSELADRYCEDGVLLLEQIPREIKFRRLMQLKDGRLLTVEENG